MRAGLAIRVAATAVLSLAFVACRQDQAPPTSAAATSTTRASTTSTSSTTSPLPTTPVSIRIDPETRWIRSTYPSGVWSSDGAAVFDASIAYFSMKTVAWDGTDGIAYLAEGETETWQLRRANPTGDRLVIEIPWFTEALADVVSVDGVAVAILFRPGLDAAGPSLRGIALADGAPVGVPTDRIRLDGPYSIDRGAQGRRAHLEDPDWSNIPRGEGGEPIPPFPLPSLVILDQSGSELIRFQVGTYERPYATIHDFDGRRIIVSVEPFEPAAAPRTVYVIDLECASCTEVIDAGPDSFDLVGSLDRQGELVAPELP